VLAVRVSNNHSVHGAGHEALHHNGLIAEGSKLYLVPFRHKTPVVEREHGKYPAATAQTVDADIFALQFSGAGDFRIGNEHAGESVDEARDENQIGALRDRAEISARDRSPVELSLPRAQRSHAHRPVAHLNERNIDTVLAKKPMFLRNINRSFSLTDRSAGHDHFSQWRCSVRILAAKDEERENRNTQSDQSQFHPEAPPGSVIALTVRS